MRTATYLPALVLLALLPPSALAQGGAGCLFDGSDHSLRQPRAFLDVNGVRAGLFNRGQLFFTGGDPHYEVPKGSGVHAIFAAGIWMGGLVDGELRIAAATYAQGGQNYEFFPGPLGADGSPPTDCTPYDRIWTVSRADLHRYAEAGIATDDLAEWPGELGAPFFDADGDGAYSLEAGDRPKVWGDQTAWWVMNDAAGPHLTTLSEPLGMEVRVTAFASASPEAALFYATFYRYELTYRGEAPLDSAYVTFWVDPDLGNYNDDYIGSDTTRNLGFVYNADDDDDEGGLGGYGAAPPAQGVRFLTTPDDRGLTVFNFYDNSGSPQTNHPGGPGSAQQYYHYMQGLWRDGTPITIGGYGTNPEGEPTTFAYSNSGSWEDPVPGYWSEVCPEPDCEDPWPPNNRRFMATTGPFRMETGETEVVTFALVWARSSSNFHSLQAMKVASDYAARAYALGALDPVRPAIAAPPAAPGAYALAAHAHPNPARERAVIRYVLPEAASVRLSVYDALGREVAVPVLGVREAGAHAAEVEASALPPGTYLYRLEAGGAWATGTFTVVH